MTFSIAGRTAIVTGAANGVGRAIARNFHAHGANVMCADMDEAGLIEECGANPQSNAEVDASPRLQYFAGDLREKLTLANLLSATLDAFDRVDILVNASRQVLTTDPMDLDDTSVETMLEQNLMTSLRLSQLIAKRMIAQAEEDEDDETPRSLGTIVNLSSIAAGRTRPGLLGFSVASAALEQMTRALALALAPERIRVNAVAFGSVMSASLHSSVRDDTSLRNDIIDGTPLGRIGEAADVADAVRFLASEGSGFMTGQIVTVDGGRSLLDAVHNPVH